MEMKVTHKEEETKAHRGRLKACIDRLSGERKLYELYDCFEKKAEKEMRLNEVTAVRYLIKLLQYAMPCGFKSQTAFHNRVDLSASHLLPGSKERISNEPEGIKCPLFPHL